MILNDVHRGIKKHKRRRRVGRGAGSGSGKTSGRGHKGQGQLAGWTAHPAFEGGQMPLSRRIPKRGFNNRQARLVKSVNVGDLGTLFQDGDEVTPDVLRERKILRGRYDMLKILGDGELGRKLKVSAHRFSKVALDKIEAAGGEVLTLAEPAPVVKGQARQRKKAGAEQGGQASPKKRGKGAATTGG